MNALDQNYSPKSDAVGGPPKPWRRIADPIFERLAGTLWVCDEEAKPVYALVNEERHDNGAGNATVAYWHCWPTMRWAYAFAESLAGHAKLPFSWKWHI